MKKVIFYILLFNTSILSSQVGEYRVKVSGHGNHSSNASCDTNLHIRLDFNNRDPHRLIDLGWFPEGRNFDIKTNRDYTFSANHRITNFYFYSQRSWSNAFGCRGPRRGSHTKSISYPYNDHLFQSSETSNNSCGDGLWYDNINVKIDPLLRVRKSGIADFLPSDSDVTIRSDTKFDWTEYNWEYSFIGSNRWWEWNNLNSFRGRDRINISATDILGNIDRTNHGRRIYIRQSSRNQLWAGYKSNTVRYTIRKSAPYITSLDIENPKCYDDKNASIILTFNRPLTSDELIGISIKNTSRTTDHSVSNITTLLPGNKYKISELYGGNHNIRIIGSLPGYDGRRYNTDGESSDHKRNFRISNPRPVEFSVNKSDVFCNGGNEGTISIRAKGGAVRKKYKYLLRKKEDTSPIIDSDWIEFDRIGYLPFFNPRTNHTIRGLSSGVYKLKIKDARDCIAKEIIRDGGGSIIGLGEEIEQEIEIKQPENPLAVSFVHKKEPSGFGFSDGEITAKIVGGTPLANGKYNYIWTHEKNGVVTTWTNFKEEVIDDTSEKAYYITLQNGIDGNYSLTITDANYNGATNKEGCTIINEANNLKEPEKLSLRIERRNPISCNPANTFRNTADDGELIAIASGGIPFDPLIDGKYKYEYTWKKKDASGNYQVISGENGDILSNREEGEYAVNIKDAKGIIVATYVNNTISVPQDATYHLEAPDLLEISYTKQDVFCHNGTDGTIDVTIKGGTGDYTIKWSNNATIEDISNLTAGTYTIKVMDDKGCEAEETIEIEEPNSPLKIEYRFFEPTFAGATNGWLEATVTGGTPLDTNEYTFVWKDSNENDLINQVTSTVTSTGNVLTLNGLGKDTYKLTIQDKNYPLAIDKQNCTIVESEYVLNDPKPLQARIIERNPISCNSTNIYGDAYSDGKLEVIASGGVKLQSDQNNGFSYFYTWKKETSPGVWTVLPSQTTNIASGLSAGNYAVNIKDANGIVLGEYQNNILVVEKDITQEIKEPELLEVYLDIQHVYCIGGSDGWANAFVKGGTAPYTFEWENGNKSSDLNGLSKGVYKLKVTDDRGCQVQIDAIIEEPKNALNITFSEFATPSTKDASDGWIKAQITGGTPTSLGAYTYYWQDEGGSLLNAQTTTQFINNSYEIILNNVPKGNYFLTIEDANYEVATTKEGCTRVEEEFNLYDPIEAVITIETPISCNQNNAFNDPFSDGALKVTVTGGVPFDSGNSYKYFWKKQNDAGVYEDLGVDNPILTGVSQGNYAVNIEDSRGVIIGEYKGLNLVNATDILFTFEEPELLTLSLSATEIACDLGNNGTATVAISGGIPPYDIQWSNGDVGATATKLISGNYLVFVTDSRGCQATGNISLTPPGGLNIEVVKQNNPTCFKGNNGEIELNISGGVSPYIYSWNTGETSTNISNLKKGTYRFSLEDAKGCKVFLDVKLEDPDEIIIDLGEDKTLCNNQSYVLNGSIEDINATYLWTSDNGFTSTDPSVTVNEKGTYTVTATSSNGCIATDTMTVIYSNVDIDADFLMSSQAYVDEEVVIFNASNHSPESFEWLLPEEILVVEKRANSIIVKFPEAKTYEIGLLSKEGDCSQELFKTIVIEESNGLTDLEETNTPFIESFTISPNPNSGIFSTNVKLVEPSEIAIRIFNMQGELMKKHATSEIEKEHNNSFNISMSSGMYVVVLETEKQTQVKRMIVN